jgi:hypothetical protein
MSTRVLFSAVVLSLAAASGVGAQDSPTAFVMATYYRCVQGDAARADALFNEHVTPVLKAEKAAGHITAFGWAKHREGGDWRRLEYMVGTDLDKMLGARDTLIKNMESPEHAKAMDEFDRVCASHDDYIWGSKAGSQAPDALARTRSPIGMTTYYECTADEDEADAIVKTAFAPVLNQSVKDGKIASWSWNEHLIGGKYRRMLVVDAASEAAALKHWADLQGALNKAAPEFTRRFGNICNSHSDYVWDLSAN